MKLLVLGGTRFLGRATVECALSRGHAVTLFHRGRTNPDLFPGLERILGDRDGGLAALGGRRWDAVIDCCGYLPRVVGDSARVLRDTVERYLFVSSISVYAWPPARGFDESHARIVLADPGVEDVTGETYGGLKALCEDAVEAAFGTRSTIVRPGLIVGPHDPTDRFPYWPRRLARGGTVLAPGDPGQPVQFIDVRDLGAWIVDTVEHDRSGRWQATGPGELLTMRAFLERAAAALDVRPRFEWVDESFLLERGVSPWTELPLWERAAESDFSTADCTRAIAAGLSFRPLEATVRDTLAWDRTREDGARPASPALTDAREAELLGVWAAR